MHQQTCCTADCLRCLVIPCRPPLQRCLKRGEFLWELIHPKDKDGLPTKTLSGRYRVKLFIMDTWRSVVVDDRMPVDLFGELGGRREWCPHAHRGWSASSAGSMPTKSTTLLPML